MASALHWSPVPEQAVHVYDRVVEAGKDLEDLPVYVCPVCGHTVLGEPPDVCPVCGSAVERVEGEALGRRLVALTQCLRQVHAQINVVLRSQIRQVQRQQVRVRIIELQERRYNMWLPRQPPPHLAGRALHAPRRRA